MTAPARAAAAAVLHELIAFGWQAQTTIASVNTANFGQSGGITGSVRECFQKA